MSNSYPIRAFIKPIAGLLLALCGFELILRSPVKKFIPLPSPYYSEIVMDREAVLKRFKAKHGDPQVLIIGSSIARANVDAETIQNELGKPTFGLGLSALSPGRTELYWNNLWKKQLGSPQIVLHLLRGTDFTDFYDAKVDEQSKKGRIERSWIEPKQSTLLETSPANQLQLTAYYGALSKSLSGQRRPFLGTAFKTDEYGCRSESRAMTGEWLAKGESSFKSPKLGIFETMTSKSNTLDIIDRLSKQFGKGYVVVFCPEYEGAWTNSEEAWEWQNRLSDLFAAKEVRFVSPLAKSDAFLDNENLFFDFVHYNKEGAVLFSKKLASMLK